MLNYDDLENDIINKLNDCFTANSLDSLFEAKNFPETEAGMQVLQNAGLANQKCFVLVIFNGSNFGDEKTSHYIAQDENITVRLVFITAFERGENGVFKLLQMCKLALLGFLPANCSKKMRITAQEMMDFQTLGIRYAQDYTTQTILVEDNAEEEILGEQFKGSVYE